jgi:hypothetical protein
MAVMTFAQRPPSPSPLPPPNDSSLSGGAQPHPRPPQPDSESGGHPRPPSPHPQPPAGSSSTSDHPRPHPPFPPHGSDSASGVGPRPPRPSPPYDGEGDESSTAASPDDIDVDQSNNDNNNNGVPSEASSGHISAFAVSGGVALSATICVGMFIRRRRSAMRSRNERGNSNGIADDASLMIQIQGNDNNGVSVSSFDGVDGGNSSDAETTSYTYVSPSQLVHDGHTPMYPVAVAAVSPSLSARTTVAR